MADTEPTGERFDETATAHGLTPQDVERIGSSPEGQAILHDLAKESGMTKERHEAMLQRLWPDVSAAKFAAVGGLTGGAAAAAGLSVAQLAKSGRVSWTVFAEAAPKTTTIGAVAGAVAAVAGTLAVNRYHQQQRRLASAQWDEQELAWTKRETQKRAAAAAPSVAK